MLNRITMLIKQSVTESAIFAPTEIYNETWMLRLVIDWFFRQDAFLHPLSFSTGTRWYSEVRMPTAFFPKFRGDKRAESWTHADAVIGDFKIGNHGSSDICLLPACRHFVVIEAKMFSRLAKKTTNVQDYDQVARSIACIAEVIQEANVPLANFEKLAFCVVAPQERLKHEPTFKEYANKDSILKKVHARVMNYDNSPKIHIWLNQCFIPLLDRIDIHHISWEEILECISAKDKEFAISMSEFYHNCITLYQRSKN